IRENNMSVYAGMKILKEEAQDWSQFFKGLSVSFLFEGIRKQRRDGTLYLNVETIQIGKNPPIPAGSGYNKDGWTVASRGGFYKLINMLMENKWELPSIVEDVTFMEKQLFLKFRRKK
ncbi:MAG: hypothetical protein ACK4G3_07810, partial [bacterium]